MSEVAPGQLLSRGPSGAAWVAYQTGGQIAAGAYWRSSLVALDPEGRWAVRDVDRQRWVVLPAQALDDLRQTVPPDLPLLVTQEGLGPVADNAGSGDTKTPTDLFRRWTMAELLAEPDDFAWLITGMVADPTYGQIAGEMKTLKTYVTGFIQVGLAAGLPIFGHFTTPASRPVVAYVGEGGRVPYTRRLRRIAAAMDVDLPAIPLHLCFDTAPVRSTVFQESLARDLAELNPGLVAIDPLYGFHGSETKASDLHAEGALLNAVSEPCVDAGASLFVVNHFNQTGTGTGLKRITMAGSGEHSDTWVLLAHREIPDVENGVFKLKMEIGSRQWGGTTWDLDLNIGRFDADAGHHDGDITWNLSRATPGPSTTPKSESPKAAACRTAIVDALADNPWKLTKTDLYARIGGTKATFDMALDSLVGDSLICHNLVARNEAGVSKRRPLWGITPNPDCRFGLGSPAEKE